MSWYWASLVAQTVKSLPVMRGTQIRSPGQEGLLEKGIATHSSILAWEVPWTEKPDGLLSKGSQRVGHNWATNTFTFHNAHKMIWKCFFFCSLERFHNTGTVLLNCCRNLCQWNNLRIYSVERVLTTHSTSLVDLLVGLLRFSIHLVNLSTFYFSRNLFHLYFQIYWRKVVHSIFTVS